MLENEKILATEPDLCQCVSGSAIPARINSNKNGKLYTLRRELTGPHYRPIMRMEDAKARTYYIREAAGQTWSTRQLERNIRSHYYKRLLGEIIPKRV